MIRLEGERPTVSRILLDKNHRAGLHQSTAGAPNRSWVRDKMADEDNHDPLRVLLDALADEVHRVQDVTTSFGTDHMETYSAPWVRLSEPTACTDVRRAKLDV